MLKVRLAATSAARSKDGCLPSDRAALADASIREQLERRSQWFPNDMERGITQPAREHLQQFCPLLRRKPRKPWVTANTWTMLRSHADVRRLFWVSIGRQNIERSQDCFVHWQRCRRELCSSFALWTRFRRARLCSTRWVLTVRPLALAARTAVLVDKAKWLHECTFQVRSDGHRQEIRRTAGCWCRHRRFRHPFGGGGGSPNVGRRSSKTSFLERVPLLTSL